MRKAQELAEPNSCLNRAKDDEMTFVLLGRDRAATVAVRAWIEERIRIGKNQRDDTQIVEAEEWIDTVLREQAVADDQANRTPDSELSDGEREDQPEEVAKNRVLERLEKRMRSCANGK